MPQALTRVAVYQRSLPVSIERVWENVHDWEHLPWLHASSFRSIALRDAGDWGWRAEIGTPDGSSFLLELVIEPGASRYVSRTLDGPAAGSEIWTRVVPVAPERTDVQVAFDLPRVPEEQVPALGQVMTRLYTRLWDEDEAMMRRRARLLAGDEDVSEPALPTRLPESLAELRRALPYAFAHEGHAYRVVELDGELLAHATRCPHALGPLGESPVADGCVTCPWHGYVFDVRSGRCRDAPLRLRRAPRIEVVDGRPRLA